MRTLCQDTFGSPSNLRSSGIQAVILTGGLGARLRGVVADRPKVLAPVNNRPFLTYLFEQVIRYGIREAILCTGYLGDQIEAAFGKKWQNLSLLYSRETAPLGTAGALRLAYAYFKTDTILVMNGDSYFDCDLETAFSWHCTKTVEATILLKKIEDTSRYGRVRIDSQGKILSFDEKSPDTGEGLINAGIYFIKKNHLAAIPENRPISIEREVFPGWVGQGLYGYETGGAFLDIGSPESYAIASSFFRKP